MGSVTAELIDRTVAGVDRQVSAAGILVGVAWAGVRFNSVLLRVAGVHVSSLTDASRFTVCLQWPLSEA